VLVPHFAGLAAFRLSGREIAEVRAALRALSTRSASVGVAGFSFGAGPALLAAADVPGLALTASFGGYADLHEVIVYLTTGIHEFGGRRYRQRPEEYNRWKLLALLVSFVEDARDRRSLDSIAKRRLAEPGGDTHADERTLGPEGRAILAVVLNRSPDAVPPLLAALPSEARAAMDRLSPLAVVPRLPGRLLIAHGVGDTSIPFTESLRLAEASHGRAAAVILETFEHTGPRALWPSIGDRVRDAGRLFRLTEGLLTVRQTAGDSGASPSILMLSLARAVLPPQPDRASHDDRSPGQCECGSTSESPALQHQEGSLRRRLVPTTWPAAGAARTPFHVPRSIQAYPATPHSDLGRPHSPNDCD
jgi:hypothetical protein